MVAISLEILGCPLEYPKPTGFAPQLTDQVVVGHPVQPGGGVVGKTLGGPCRERGHQRGLNRVLDDFEMAHPGQAREHGHQPAVLVPEEMLDQAGRAAADVMASNLEPAGQELAISRISTLAPGIAIPGISFATSSAPS